MIVSFTLPTRNRIPQLSNVLNSIYNTCYDVNNFDFRGKTAIFYLNTNNGYTLFEDGTKIESVANRLLTFDANLPHTGTSCTDKQFRCVLNINYFPR